jgi:hypothetical protein
MSEHEKAMQPQKESASGRRGFLYTAFGGAVAALAGWIAGVFPREARPAQEETGPSGAEARISTLEARVEQLGEEPPGTPALPPLGELEGERNERVVFNKSELTVANPEGVLLNLVATHGHVGIRFYKDFGFGNEQTTNPWHMGYIEGIEGYQGLAILRDWRFTAALWGEDGRLLLGSLHPHPPANEPARARVHVRGTLDEVQTLVEASADQTADVFQVSGGQGTTHFAVTSEGKTVIGTQSSPKEVILHDTADGTAYSLKVTNGQLLLTRA